MKNLENAIRSELQNKINEYSRLLTEHEEKEMFIKRDAPKNSKRWEKLNTIEEKIDFLVKQEEKHLTKYYLKKIDQLNAISNNKQNIEEITISVEWKKSRTWGANPTATVRVTYSDKSTNMYTGTASGCGYDKESAAISVALNQSNALLKLLCNVKDKDANKTNHEVLGYGSGYGFIPTFEGGVGVSCYYDIFEKIGFKLVHISSGKTFDVYRASKQ